MASLDATLRHAKERYAAGDLSAAATACRDLIDLQPGHFDALHLLGVIDLREGRLHLGLRSIDQALLQRPDDPTAKLSRGNALLALENPSWHLRTPAVAMPCSRCSVLARP
jgi:predicted Zn-dependent protease